MKRFFGLGMTAIAAVALTVLLSNIGGSPTTANAAAGPGISLGTVTGNVVNVNVTTSANPWQAYNIHVSTNVSAGVTLSSIAGANGPLLPGAFCTPDPSIPGDLMLGCFTFPANIVSVTSAGVIATFTFNATGNGCIVVRLVTVPPSPLSASLDTYTADTGDGLPQTNTVSAATVNVLIGTGIVADCVVPPTATPTVTNTPLPTNTPTPTFTATPCGPFGCPTASPTLTPSAPLTGTLTPTGTPATATATATTTPPAPPPAPSAPAGVAPPAGNAGAARGGIRLPDTGSGVAGAGGSAIWIAISVAAAMLGASALVLSRRRA